MKSFEQYIKETARQQEFPVTGDVVECNINEELAVDLAVLEHTDDSIVVEIDAVAQYILEHCGCSVEEELDEAFMNWQVKVGDKVWKGTARNAGEAVKKAKPSMGNLDLTKASVTRIDEAKDKYCSDACCGSDVKAEDCKCPPDCPHCNCNAIDEAEYQGREVKLGKPMRGDVKKYKVFVKDPKTGNVKKVNFGSKEMEIKRDDPARRKSFRARHGCGTPRASDRTKAAYWSCRMWSSKPVSKILKGK